MLDTFDSIVYKALKQAGYSVSAKDTDEGSLIIVKDESGKDVKHYVGTNPSETYQRIPGH